MRFRFLPMVRTRGSRVEYGISTAARATTAAFALALFAIGLFLPPTSANLARVAPRALWWAVAFILALGALSEDSWIFDGGKAEIRRRFGMLFLARSWSLPLTEAESIALMEGEGKGDALDDLRGTASERQRLAASLQGLGRGSWTALVIRLSGGRTLILSSTAGSRSPGSGWLSARGRRDSDRLLADGRLIAGVARLEFKDLRPRHES